MAARQGGGDPDANPTLRTMYQKARDNSVPLDTIERAVKRGTGELEGVSYESIAYEGYAPGGVALYIECLTDNRNRTGSEVRSTLTAQRRVAGRAGLGGLAVRAQGRGAGAVVGGGGGRPDDGGARRRGRGPGRRRRHVEGHHRAGRPQRGARGAGRGRHRLPERRPGHGAHQHGGRDRARRSPPGAEADGPHRRPRRRAGRATATSTSATTSSKNSPASSGGSCPRPERPASAANQSRKGDAAAAMRHDLPALALCQVGEEAGVEAVVTGQLGMEGGHRGRTPTGTAPDGRHVGPARPRRDRCAPPPGPG